MLTGRERAAEAIARAHKVAREATAELAALAKAAGVDAGEVLPMRAVAGREGALRAAVAAGVAKALGVNAARETESADEALCKAAHELVEAVALATGETREDRLVEMIEQALQEPLSFDMNGGARELAKAALAEGPMPRLVGGVALERAREQLAQAELLKAHGAGPHPEKMREIRSDVDALAALRDVGPLRIGHAARPWTDNRTEIKEAIKAAREVGDAGGLSRLHAELDLAEARAATRAPMATATIQGVTVPA